MKTLITIFLSLLSLTSYAQYTDYFLFSDIKNATINNLVFNDVYYTDFKILESNKVKSIVCSDENGNVTSRMNVNRNGFIEYYYNVNGNDTAEYTITWDENDMIQNIYYKQKRYGTNYKFFYENEVPAKIFADYGSIIEADYLFSYEYGRLSAFHYNNNDKDSIYFTGELVYDDKGRLAKVRPAGSNYTLDSIVYNGENIIINQRGDDINIYTIVNGRISIEEKNYPAPQPRGLVPGKEFPKFYTHYKYYHYRADGLIDYTTFNKMDYISEDGKILYKYEYW